MFWRECLCYVRKIFPYKQHSKLWELLWPIQTQFFSLWNVKVYTYSVKMKWIVFPSPSIIPSIGPIIPFTVLILPKKFFSHAIQLYSLHQCLQSEGNTAGGWIMFLTYHMMLSKLQKQLCLLTHQDSYTDETNFISSWFSCLPVWLNTMNSEYNNLMQSNSQNILSSKYYAL